MPGSPIGISFLPSQDQAAMGPRQGGLEGDLGEAFKVLSLHLPRVLGARAIAPRKVLEGGGSGALGGGFNPHAAVFEAMLQALAGGGEGGGSTPGGNSVPDPFFTFGDDFSPGPPSPRVPGMPNEPRMFDDNPYGAPSGGRGGSQGGYTRPSPIRRMTGY